MKRFISIIILVVIIVLFITINHNLSTFDSRIISFHDESILDNDIDLINIDVKQITNKYEDFNKIIKEANISIPLEDGFVPQGIALIDDYILVSGYYENGNNSLCYILDQKGNIYNIVDLNNTSHVGSIAYDKKNNLIWIPGIEGSLNAYDVTEILTKNEVDYKYQFNKISDSLIDYLDDTKNSIAYLTIDDNYLYVGGFSIKEACLVKKYKINNINEIKLEYINSFKLPSKTQGITFITHNNKKYLITSNSYGRTKLSRINIYEYDNKILDYSLIEDNKYIDLPPMSEQIQIHNDSLYVIFESGAIKYYDGFDKIKFICVLNIKEYL